MPEERDEGQLRERVDSPGHGLRIDQLSVVYRRRDGPAVDGVSLTFGPGRTALLGPNGAGKSTLLATVGGAGRRWGGAVVAEPSGSRLGTREYARQVGWMPQDVRPIAGFTVREQVAYHAWLKGHSMKRAWVMSVPALATAGLTDLADRQTQRLSGGQIRRVGLAQTMVADPTVVLLDEPTVGLDPAQRARFRALLGSLPHQLVVVVSTHLVDDLDELFDRVVVLAGGTVRFDGPLEEFMVLGGERPQGQAEAAYAVVVGEAEA